MVVLITTEILYIIPIFIQKYIRVCVIVNVDSDKPTKAQGGVHQLFD